MVNRASTEPRCTQDQILRFRADRMIPPNAVMAVSDTLPSGRAAGVTANGAVDTESAAITRAVFVLTFLEPTESDKGTVRHTAPSGCTDHISRLSSHARILPSARNQTPNKTIHFKPPIPAPCVLTLLGHTHRCLWDMDSKATEAGIHIVTLPARCFFGKGAL
jgi:hypothetical protein